ncbi:MFS transporter [Streptomyces cylindrosporus]|uniref:MFS transporter n=1 Tax=Streptomyces cylindrosporus TaxID=2927583 RepID=A0ABS9Y873_9ACTN|nr:MFS transporter [Streptomyces cylindrosporus]MCI3273425.1 MFS transporter [Streptomyces cylindrosporus]
MPLVIWSLLSRLAFAMTNLSLLLYVSAASGSYAFAGGMTAVSLIGTAAGAIGQGRLIDRFGPSRPLLALTAAYGPLSLALIAMVPAQHSPDLLLVCTVFAQSATQPLLAVASRAMWPRLVPADAQRQTAYSYETISTETCYLIAPAIAATLAAAMWPGTPLSLACGVITTTALGFALAPAARRHRGRDETTAQSPRHPHAVVRQRGMPILLIAALGFGTGVGFVAVGIPAAATALGATPAAGLLLATWSVSSVLGGLTYNRRPWPSEPSLRLPMLMAAFGLLLCPVFIGGFYGLAAAMILTGLTLAPQLTTQNALLDTLVPPHQVSEAFGWITTAIALGNATGQAASGALIELSGHETAFRIGILSVLACTAAVTVGRRHLRPHPTLRRTTAGNDHLEHGN